MEDLLNEGDFTKSKPYDPSKVFGWFYGIGFLQFILALVFLAFVTDSTLLVCIVLLLPIIMGLVMFFWKKEHAHLPFNVLAMGLFRLFCVYFIPAVLFGIIAEGIDSLVAVLILFFIEYGICLGIVLLLANRLSRK